ncbi:unnamed protein product [Rotaria magnacalcarata]|uniref:Uncharacterized protein n=5 Tax=Rotaria magnacalcarata TaxID=392030 RepID=A0A816S0P8_9BILA|nr:unnamed protein product [Rotaria magnacalcarata]CAF2082216.1 unnamed protein product [Rotaria magnacalcarata]
MTSTGITKRLHVVWFRLVSRNKIIYSVIYIVLRASIIIMLKLISSLLAVLFVISILYSSKVECRVIEQDYNSIPASQLQFITDQSSEDNQKKVYQNEDKYVKRKSDFLLSLYGLPYTLVNKRNFHR